MDPLKQRIEEMHHFVSNSTYYEVLGVETSATKDEITKAFRALAKDWHVDRFNHLDLGKHRQILQEVFASLNKAYQVLSHADRRAEYNGDLNGENEDASDMVSLIFAASAEFRQGKTMLQRGSYKGAYEKFRTAYEKQPEEREYQAHLSYCEYLMASKDDEGLARNKARAQEIYNELDEISKSLTEKDWLFLFLGTVAAGLGRTRSAHSLYSEALMINPNNHEAQRQIRLIKMRKDAKSKGFFSKLFAKK